jgi:cell fate (sporulation/competence/biofilm development) regulator YmcA (YheA/YmcA/DUF963 family)
MFNLDTQPLIAKIEEFTQAQQATNALLQQISQQLTQLLNKPK